MTTTDTLTPLNHDRDSAGMTYVYPVVSRRAGGVSIGVYMSHTTTASTLATAIKIGDPASYDRAVRAIREHRDAAPATHRSQLRQR